jgi:hypothetical protein
MNPNVYVSEWGIFPIPPHTMLEMYDRRKRSFWPWVKHVPVMDVKPLPANKVFWQWLHDEEVKEGKPK